MAQEQAQNLATKVQSQMDETKAGAAQEVDEHEEESSQSLSEGEDNNNDGKQAITPVPNFDEFLK